METEQHTDCDHKCPPGYVDKRLKMRFHKGKKYSWLKCPNCNIVFTSVSMNNGEAWKG